MKTKNLIIISIIFLIVLGGAAVDAYIPVTYTCCNNFSNSSGNQFDSLEHINENSGNQLDNFENLSNWTVGLGTNYADTVNFKEGNQSLGLISPNNSRVYSDRVLNDNFLNTNIFSTWIYVYNASTFDYPRIYLTSTGGMWSKYFYGSYYGGMSNGWNKLILNNKSFENFNNESWNNSMNRIRIAMYPKTGLTTNLAVDDLRYNVSPEWMGTGGSQEPDTLNFKEGSEGLKLIATNGNRAYSDKIIDNDFSNTNNFVIWLYVYDASSFDFIRIYLTSTEGSWSKYYQNSIYGLGYKTGWNKLVFSKNSFVNFYNESWNNRMKRIRIAIYPKIGQNTNATIDDLRTDMNGKRGKIIIGFDDGDKNVYAKAFPILNANNQSGVSFVVTSWVGDPGYMNLSDLKILQSNGWDISSHTVNHEELISLDNSTLIYELNNSYDWLVNNNFQKSAGFIAYPYGEFNDNVINFAKKRYIFGRATSTEATQQHFDPSDEAELYIQRIIYAYNTTSVNSIKNLIDDSINSKLLGILLFHDIVDSNPAKFEYLKTDFQNISDYIKSRSDDIDVITYSDYVTPNINNFTPIINKTTRIFSNGSSILITKNKYDELMPNMTVMPSQNSIDINITQYNETGGIVKFNESSENSSMSVFYYIGDRIPNQLYNVKIYWANGTKYQDFPVPANNTGYINYSSQGFGNPRYQEINPSNNIPPPSPMNINSSAGNFWINHSWEPGAGNVTDSYNVSMNDLWTNGTTSTYSNSTVAAHGWSNITVYAYNTSGTGTLNLTPIFQNIQVVNNIPVQTGIGDKTVTSGDLLTFNVTANDLDNDTITYGTNATRGILNTTTGTYSWPTNTSDVGIYVWFFNSSDSYGDVVSETITVTVNDTPISVQLDGFENLNKWYIGGIGASQKADTVNFKEGQQGLKLIATNGYRAFTDKAINNNFSTANNFSIWLYIPDNTNFSLFRVYFTSTGSRWSKYFTYSKYSGFQSGWNILNFNKSSFTNTNGENWNNKMSRTRIAIYPTTGINTNTTVDDFRFTP